jgi:hypothetical protein
MVVLKPIGSPCLPQEPEPRQKKSRAFRLHRSGRSARRFVNRNQSQTCAAPHRKGPAVKAIVVAATATLLAACTPSGRETADAPLAPPLLAPPPLAQRPSVFATPSAPPIQRTTVSERTTLSPDGSTLRTTRTTTSVGFDPDKAAAAAGRLLSAAAGPSAYQGIPGTWTSRSSSTGTGCTVALYGAPDATSGGAASACNSSSVLGGVSGWRYENGRLTLLKGQEVALAMNQAGPNRFDGTATWGFLSTNISLFR